MTADEFLHALREHLGTLAASMDAPCYEVVREVVAGDPAFTLEQVIDRLQRSGHGAAAERVRQSVLNIERALVHLDPGELPAVQRQALVSILKNER